MATEFSGQSERLAPLRRLAAITQKASRNLYGFFAKLASALGLQPKIARSQLDSLFAVKPLLDRDYSKKLII